MSLKSPIFKSCPSQISRKVGSPFATLLTASIPVSEDVAAYAAVHGPERLHVLKTMVVQLWRGTLPCPSFIHRG